MNYSQFHQQLDDDLQQLKIHATYDNIRDKFDLQHKHSHVCWLGWSDSSCMSIINARISSTFSRCGKVNGYFSKTAPTDRDALIDRLQKFSPDGLGYEAIDGELRTFQLESDLFGGDYQNAVLLPASINHCLKMKGSIQYRQLNNKYQLQISGVYFGVYHSKQIAHIASEQIIKTYRSLLVDCYAEVIHPDLHQMIIDYRFK